eukprot:1195502-Prorocentrum_minimum.AAC.1
MSSPRRQRSTFLSGNPDQGMFFQVPLDDPPELFGLDANAEITRSAREAADMAAIILHIQPKESAGAGADGIARDDVVRGLWGVECTLAVIGTGGPAKRGRMIAITRVVIPWIAISRVRIP